MENVNLNDIYFWRRKSPFNYPWQRQFLNTDYLKTEKKRIEDVKQWWNNFFKKKLENKLKK